MAGSDMTIARREGFFASLLTPKGVILCWLVYALVNALIPYVYSHTLYTDDASESLLVQTLRLGYTIRNPPLWEWLLWTVQQVVGPGVESHLLLRYGSIALIGIAIFRASRAVSGDIGWAAAVSLSMPLFYALGWVLFRSNTHTLLLLIACLLTIEVAIRYAREPGYAKAALLGFFVGLGFLTKYGYALHLVALLTALLVTRETRGAVLRREFLLVPLVALAVFSPYLSWLAENHADLVGMSRGNLVTTDDPHLQRIAAGLSRAIELIFEFLMPFAAIAGFVAWQGRRRADRPAVPAGLGERIAGRALLVSLLILLAGIVMLGATKLNAAYIMPVIVPAIPYSAGLLSRAAPSDARGMAVIGLGSLVVITLIHWAYLANSGFPPDAHRRDMLPYAGLASEMRRLGMDRGTLVTAGFRDGGNLRAELPELRVVTMGQEDRHPPVGSTHGEACRLLWNSTRALYPDARWARSSGEGGEVEQLPQLAGRERRNFDIPWPPTYFGTSRVSRWTIVELDPGDPLCR